MLAGDRGMGISPTNARSPLAARPFLACWMQAWRGAFGTRLGAGSAWHAALLSPREEQRAMASSSSARPRASSLAGGQGEAAGDGGRRHLPLGSERGAEQARAGPGQSGSRFRGGSSRRDWDGDAQHGDQARHPPHTGRSSLAADGLGGRSGVLRIRQFGHLPGRPPAPRLPGRRAHRHLPVRAPVPPARGGFPFHPHRGAGSPGGPPEEIRIFPIPVVPAQRERQHHLPGPHQQGRCCRARAGREKGSLETCPKLHPSARPQLGLCNPSAPPSQSLLSFWDWILDFLALFPHGTEIWGGSWGALLQTRAPQRGGEGCSPCPSLMTIIIILCLALQPPSSSASWFWDYAVGYYLLEFLLWISTFVPSLVCWINRFFFWLLFSSRVENIAVSYKIFNYECRFKQHVQDWAIPIEKTKEALLELKAALENNPKMVAHYPVEVRFARGDGIWLSPCFQRDSCYMNIIMYRPYGKNVPRLNYWLTYEGIMKKYGGRPHWAKAHSCTRKDFEKMYPAFPKFCSVREKLDPTGMFLNTYLEKVFY
uniref:D-arabinono-1,4-lactone oxidase C-terminal domain-containing protein n=1 Tax=Anas platyrhynchos platyrhynchos TaxID=8840 RepID=A0A493SXZ0_ANAPP